MVLYRRNFLPGASYFFTVTLINRQSRLLVDYVEILRQSFQATKEKSPFEIQSIVILPDHIHTIWQLPEYDCNYSSRWRNIKALFTRGIKENGVVIPVDPKGRHEIWQSRFWEHTIKDEEDLERCTNYIHINPVKHRLVDQVMDWPYSSFHRFVEKGWLDRYWSTDQVEGDFGE